VQTGRKFGGLGATVALSASIILSGGFAQVANAASSGSGGTGSTISIPYIAGRLGPVTRAPSEAPVGSVIPDDFCIPGKFNDCGDHLRDSPDFSPVPNSAAQDGPIFIGGDNPAFNQAETRIWGQVQFRETSLNSTSEQIDQFLISAGGDRRFGDSFILGAMVVSNDITTSFSLTGIEDSETGIFVGPYLAFRLSDVWSLDARYIFGTTQHTVTTGGIFTGEYESQGSFGAVRVSGTFDRGNWRLHPSLELATERQDSDAYIDGLRGPIAASSSSENFVTGAVLAYFNGLGVSNGNLIPYGGLEVTQPTGGSGNLFGVLRGGLALTMDSGAVLNFDFAQGAIGLSDIEDRLISLRLEIPL